MQSQTRRSLHGFLAIGPHRLDAQLRALTDYAARTGHALDAFWTLLPGENPAVDAPDPGFPVVAFDDEIAGFTPEEADLSFGTGGSAEDATVEWHVAYAVPQPKRPTMHLPVYGHTSDQETAADAVLCVGRESLDRQIARIEAFALRTAIRLRGVYVAADPDGLQLLLRDFIASNKALGSGRPILVVGPRGEIDVHG